MRDVKQNIPDIREIGLFYALLIVKQLAASKINEYLMQIESVTKPAGNGCTSVHQQLASSDQRLLLCRLFALHGEAE